MQPNTAPLGFRFISLFGKVSMRLFFVGVALAVIRIWPQPSWLLIALFLTSPFIAVALYLAYDAFTPKTEPGGSPGIDEKMQ